MLFHTAYVSIFVAEKGCCDLREKQACGKCLELVPRIAAHVSGWLLVAVLTSGTGGEFLRGIGETMTAID